MTFCYSKNTRLSEWAENQCPCTNLSNTDGILYHQETNFSRFCKGVGSIEAANAADGCDKPRNNGCGCGQVPTVRVIRENPTVLFNREEPSDNEDCVTNQCICCLPCSCPKQSTNCCCDEDSDADSPEKRLRSLEIEEELTYYPDAENPHSKPELSDYFNICNDCGFADPIMTPNDLLVLTGMVHGPPITYKKKQRYEFPMKGEKPMEVIQKPEPKSTQTGNTGELNTYSNKIESQENGLYPYQGSNNTGGELSTYSKKIEPQENGLYRYQGGNESMGPPPQPCGEPCNNAKSKLLPNQSGAYYYHKRTKEFAPVEDVMKVEIEKRRAKPSPPIIKQPAPQPPVSQFPNFASPQLPYFNPTMMNGNFQKQCQPEALIPMCIPSCNYYSGFPSPFLYPLQHNYYDYEEDETSSSEEDMKSKRRRKSHRSKKKSKPDKEAKKESKKSKSSSRKKKKSKRIDKVKHGISMCTTSGFAHTSSISSSTTSSSSTQTSSTSSSNTSDLCEENGLPFSSKARPKGLAKPVLNTQDTQINHCKLECSPPPRAMCIPPKVQCNQFPKVCVMEVQYNPPPKSMCEPNCKKDKCSPKVHSVPDKNKVKGPCCPPPKPVCVPRKKLVQYYPPPIVICETKQRKILCKSTKVNAVSKEEALAKRTTDINVPEEQATTKRTFEFKESREEALAKPTSEINVPEEEEALAKRATEIIVGKKQFPSPTNIAYEVYVFDEDPANSTPEMCVPEEKVTYDPIPEIYVFEENDTCDPTPEMCISEEQVTCDPTPEMFESEDITCDPTPEMCVSEAEITCDPTPEMRVSEEEVTCDPTPRVSNSNKLVSSNPTPKVSNCNKLVSSNPTPKVSNCNKLVSSNPTPKVSNSNKLVSSNPTPKVSNCNKLVSNNPTPKMSKPEKMVSSTPSPKVSKSDKLVSSNPTPKVCTSDKLVSSNPSPKVSKSDKLVSSNPFPKVCTSDKLVSSNPTPKMSKSEKLSKTSFKVPAPTPRYESEIKNKSLVQTLFKSDYKDQSKTCLESKSIQDEENQTDGHRKPKSRRAKLFSRAKALKGSLFNLTKVIFEAKEESTLTGPPKLRTFGVKGLNTCGVDNDISNRTGPDSCRKCSPAEKLQALTYDIAKQKKRLKSKPKKSPKLNQETSNNNYKYPEPINSNTVSIVKAKKPNHNYNSPPTLRNRHHIHHQSPDSVPGSRPSHQKSSKTSPVVHNKKLKPKSSRSSSNIGKSKYFKTRNMSPGSQKPRVEKYISSSSSSQESFESGKGKSRTGSSSRRNRSRSRSSSKK